MPNARYPNTSKMGCFTVNLKLLGSLSPILVTRLLITKVITDQDTDSKYVRALRSLSMMTVCVYVMKLHD